MEQPGWWIWVVDIAQVVGAVGSVVAIVVAGWSISSTNRTVVRERRLDFELASLKELGQQPVDRTATRVGLTAVLGPSIVPMACAFVAYEATPEMSELFNARTREVMAADQNGSGDAVAKILRAEVIEQIRQRVAARR